MTDGKKPLPGPGTLPGAGSRDPGAPPKSPFWRPPDAAAPVPTPQAPHAPPQPNPYAPPPPAQQPRNHLYDRPPQPYAPPQQPNPYAQPFAPPQQPSAPSGAPQPNPYAQPPAPFAPPHQPSAPSGAPQPNPYAQPPAPFAPPHQPSAPSGAPQPPQPNPYAQPPAPFAPPHQPSAPSGAPQPNPYAQPPAPFAPPQQPAGLSAAPPPGWGQAASEARRPVGMEPPAGPPPNYPTGGRRTHLVSTVAPPKGNGFGAMAMLSMKRAFRLRIEPNEVLDDERLAMLRATPPIGDESQQAFLAWRRSVLFVAALLMIPVAILHAVENFRDTDGFPQGWKTLMGIEAFVEVGFTLFLWTQVPRWTQWRRQGRRLSRAWLIYFLVPFLVFLYPIASQADYGEMDPSQLSAVRAAVGVAVGARAFVSLAPKVISMLQGLIRASIATKTLFPGATAPGWLMVIAAPLYMVIFYVFVLLPYHFTGSGYVVAGMLLVLAAKSTLVRAGLGFARPMTDEAARTGTQRALKVWMGLLVAGAVLIVGGLWDLVSKASGLTLVNFALSMGSNILLLTLIATDALITALDRARGTTAEERALADETAADVAAFTASGAQ